MADTTPTTPAPAATPGVTPGTDTSEYRLTKFILILSVIVAVCGGITETLTQMTTVMPGAKWIGAILTCVGLVSAAASQVGYALSRGIVKAGASFANPPAPVTPAAANANLTSK